MAHSYYSRTHFAFLSSQGLARRTCPQAVRFRIWSYFRLKHIPVPTFSILRPLTTAPRCFLHSHVRLLPRCFGSNPPTVTHNCLSLFYIMAEAFSIAMLEGYHVGLVPILQQQLTIAFHCFMYWPWPSQ